MKKILFTLAMTIMLSMTAMAGENNTASTEAYEMKVNTERLASSLGASKDQAEAVNDVMTLFNQQMANIAVEQTDTARQRMLDNTVKMNTGYMKQILDRDQYKWYLVLLNTTLNNRGLK